VSGTSPITSAALTASSVGLSSFSFAVDDEYWLESRPADGGRAAIITELLDGPGAPIHVMVTAAVAPAGAETADTWDVRSRAHEYGGGSYVVDPASGTAYFSNFTDQRVYAVQVNGAAGYGSPRAITEADKGYAFADFIFEPRGKRLFCVRETHVEPGASDKPEANSGTSRDLKLSPSVSTLDACTSCSQPAAISTRHRGCRPIVKRSRSWHGTIRQCQNRLKGKWGVVDVDDRCNATLHLTEVGLVDKNRLTISGASAGGFTTLACLAFRHEGFSAGASYYGVADLNLLVAETHKFESHYLDSLVGPYPAARAVYASRSPAFSADRARSPLVQFHGLEDRGVSPSQARAMFEALQQSGIPTAFSSSRGSSTGFL
jgi:hypothetical protein